MGISDRGTQAKSITSCDNAFVTNIVSAQAAHRTPPGSFALRESEATATMFYLCESVVLTKRQQQMFYLRESEATAANVLSVRKRSANEASATNVLSARKRSDSGKCFICAKA
ncbi:hypothetical protein ACPCXF_14850 [Lysinibacillus agricola]